MKSEMSVGLLLLPLLGLIVPLPNINPGWAGELAENQTLQKNWVIERTRVVGINELLSVLEKRMIREIQQEAIQDIQDYLERMTTFQRF